VRDIPAFNKTAALVSEAGYKVIGSPDDLFRFYNGDNNPPLVSDGKLTVPDEWKNWAGNARAYNSKDYFASNAVFMDSWTQSIESGKTFCYAGPQWFVDYTILKKGERDSDNSGDWAITTPPGNFFLGGTFLSVAAGSDNAHLAYDIISGLSADSEIQKKIAGDPKLAGYGYAPTLRSVTKELAADEKYKDPALGGQNPYAVYDKAAQLIDVNPENYYITAYSYYGIASCMDYYIKNDISYDAALEIFYKTVKDNYPEIVIPE
jgi:hypothetical protein